MIDQSHPILHAFEEDTSPCLFALETASRKYTRDGGPELEKALDRLCDRILWEIRRAVPESALEAVLLGGGYGRGEGGVLRTPEGDRPYNDLEFYIAVRGNRRLAPKRFAPRLSRLAERLTESLDIEIEFKAISLRQLARDPCSMFYYDLINGHHWLWGDPAALKNCSRHAVGENIPLSEATRLMMNRFSGLLFAQNLLLKTDPSAQDLDFIQRNIAKAKLAMGDAALVLFGQYHWSAMERHHRLCHLTTVSAIPCFLRLLKFHSDGVAFKLHPARETPGRAALAVEMRRVKELAADIFLWFESRRLKVQFDDVEDYAFSSHDKFPETGRLRNGLLHALAFGPGSCLTRRAWRAPRERLLHALALLLWRPHEAHTPRSIKKLRRELQAKEASFPALLERYTALWRRFQ